MSRNNGMDRRQLLKLAGLSAAGLGLTAAGCGSGSGSGGPVTIRHSWWGADDRAKKIQKCVAPLREEAPEDQGEDGLPAVRGLLEEVQHPGGRRQPPGRHPERRRPSCASTRQERPPRPEPQAEKGNLDLGGFRSGLEKFAEIDGKLLGVPVGSNSMPWSSTRRCTRRPASPRRSAGRGEYWLAGQEKIKRGQGISGDAGPHGVMYLYDLILRQNGKAFFTEDGMGFGEAELLPYWTEALERVKSGLSPTPARSSRSSPPPRPPRASPPASSPGTTSRSATASEGKSSSASRPSPAPTARRPASTWAP